jgi:hypothetical protein
MDPLSIEKAMIKNMIEKLENQLMSGLRLLSIKNLISIVR